MTSFCNNDCLLGGMSLLHSYIIGCFITIREGKPNSQVELIHENSNGEALLPLLCSGWYWQNSDPIQTKKILKFRPNSDWFWPFSPEIQTCWDSPTGCVYDYVTFIDVAKIVQTIIIGSFKKQMNLKVRYRWHCCECNVPMRPNCWSQFM